MIRLLVGLGNPGPEYEATRHNAGFWWLDVTARALGATLAYDRAYHGLVARVNRPDGPVWLLQPMTFMNLSGKAVSPLARFFKITPEQLLVIHDELDLAPGQMKLKHGGGVAGHKGLMDIRSQLGTADFWRLRIGIGHPGDRAEVVNYVLRRPTPDQRDDIEKCIDKSIEALPLLLDGAMERATMLIHGKPPRPKAAAPSPSPSPSPAGATATTETPPAPSCDAPPITLEPP